MEIHSVGPFIIGKTLGQGTTGKVKLGFHKETGFKVGIKIINKELLISKPSMRRKIEREIVLMKLIDHPNALKMYEVYETSKYLFLILEYVEGGELFDYLVEKGGLESGEALFFFQQIITGLDYCHNRSICHRDLKPENLLLSGDKKIKICDFGMGSIVRKDNLLHTSCGSPHYASPEVVSGIDYEGQKADVWSCGVILYALLTGKLPFDDENIRRLLNKVKNGAFVMPPFIHKDAQDLLTKMLTVDPKKRISIREIKKHPWFLSNNIIPQKVTPLDEIACQPLPDLSLLDDEIFRSLMVLGLGNVDDVKRQLVNSDKSQVIVYYRLLEERKKYDIEGNKYGNKPRDVKQERRNSISDLSKRMFGKQKSNGDLNNIQPQQQPSSPSTTPRNNNNNNEQQQSPSQQSPSQQPSYSPQQQHQQHHHHHQQQHQQQSIPPLCINSNNNNNGTSTNNNNGQRPPSPPSPTQQQQQSPPQPVPHSPRHHQSDGLLKQALQQHHMQQHQNGNVSPISISVSDKQPQQPHQLSLSTGMPAPSPKLVDDHHQPVQRRGSMTASTNPATSPTMSHRGKVSSPVEITSKVRKLKLSEREQPSNSPIIGSSPKKSWFSYFFSKNGDGTNSGKENGKNGGKGSSSSHQSGASTASSASSTSSTSSTSPSSSAAASSTTTTTANCRCVVETKIDSSLIVVNLEKIFSKQGMEWTMRDKNAHNGGGLSYFIKSISNGDSNNTPFECEIDVESAPPQHISPSSSTSRIHIVQKSGSQNRFTNFTNSIEQLFL
ncbi:putative protein serine/threonine kinase [Cavenderia fasciculata]|uniref:Protein kinase domain-containing protein n=1 Tax=Cavenderia fasciculata TaxID=261658 RepID=F4PQQ2_CACFS|nr:putative protein serine/threonine kinase [Cavenderia fasciculata]EGG22010.1 putative protein serine/threonine kinase [Cavenderia fasciculata]|eukprot:XP_004359861.1 putative protein serine/threonine kinase [Cavenderia fasciculata]